VAVRDRGRACRLAEQTGDLVFQLEGHALRFWDFLEAAKLPEARREFEVCCRLAEQTRQPYYLWLMQTCRVLLAFVEGRLGDVEPLAQQALQMGQEAQNQNASLVFGVDLMLVYREQGRSQELAPLIASYADMYPLIRHRLQCAQAVLACEEGRAAAARGLFDELAAADFADTPRDITSLFVLAYLSETAAFLHDAARAEKLYERLRPFAERNVCIAPVAAFGVASRYLGLLAATLGRADDAARHFEDALAINGRMGARQAVARTQVEYADLLLARGGPGDRAKALDLLNRGLDTARELGMKLVVEQGLALKLRAQGIPSGDLNTSMDAVAAAVARERPDLRHHASRDGTVTILFTDIEGSTAMIERLGDRRAHEVLRAHNALVRAQIAFHRGVEVKSQGDGFMVAFQIARDALGCAVAIQRAFTGDVAKRIGEVIRVRIGLHTGEAIRDADDFFGKAVVLAARIADQARGGEILCSAELARGADGAGEFRIEPGRAVALKGLSGTFAVCRVAWETPPAGG
jgi:class 3 adenylate cyclase